MQTYIVTNWNLGRALSRTEIQAYSAAEAVLAADRLPLPAAGLPGTGRTAAAKSRVLSIALKRSRA